MNSKKSVIILMLFFLPFMTEILHSKDGKLIGRIGSVNKDNKEIIVNTESGCNLKMGEQVYVRIGDEIAVMEISFPMMTSSKCVLMKDYVKNISKIEKGTKVHMYDKSILADKSDSDSSSKHLKVMTFGNIEMVYLKGGEFMMGSPESEKDRKDDEFLHKVELSPFWIGKYEVMQQQYREIMGNNPSCFVGDIRPVEQVTWYDAVEFCNRLSEKNGLKPYYKIEKGVFSTNVTILGGDGFRLPSEAEWEYACRGGTTTAYYWGNKIDGAYCWYTGNSSERTYIIGMKKPNAFGLYDITGNVYEWCWDWYDKSYYKNSPFKDPQGPDKGRYRVRRGGSTYIASKNVKNWAQDKEDIRSSQRCKALPGADGFSDGSIQETTNESSYGYIHYGGAIGVYIGFRVARTMD